MEWIKEISLIIEYLAVAIIVGMVGLQHRQVLYLSHHKKKFAGCKLS